MVGEIDVSVRVDDDGRADAIDADRDIQQLSARNNKLSGLFIIIAAILGVLFLLFSLLFGGDDEVQELEERVERRMPTNEPLQLPRRVETEVEPEEEDEGFRLAALEMERLRQLALLREQQSKLNAERLAAAREAERKRRSSEMVLFDSAGGDGELTDSEFARQQMELLTASTSGSNDGGFSEFGGFGGDEEQAANEIFSDSNERFLRDAAEAEVVEVAAVKLQNQNFMITQGTIVSGVLETAMNSDLPGMVRALVDNPVYSRTGSQVLIPRGSRLVGRYSSGIDTGQSRIYVVWSRLERPDGIVIDIGSPGTDSLGRSGLGGDVDTHFFERFGASALLSAIGPAIALAAGDSQTTAQRDTIQSAERDLQSSARIALEDSINIPPTITVDQGTEIAIFVNRDLSFAKALGAIR